MRNNIMTKASRTISMAGLKLKKLSPEILMVAGIAGTVVSTVMACKATTKVDKILNDAKEQVNAIHKVAEQKPDEYEEQDVKKALTITYAQTGVKLAKLYAPSVALGVLSVTSIVAGHHILKKRNIALAAAYAVVDKGFKDYRKNVVEHFGQEIDKELRYNLKAKEIETETVDENGEKTTKKEIVNTVNSESVLNESDYARFFDECSPYYRKDNNYNLMFLRKQQDWANEKLKSQGYLFLNDVYEMLGIQKSVAGQTVGWVYNKENPKGDNYIDFGIYSGDEGSRLFVNGYENSILLDFNVDGNILYSPIFEK